MAPALKLTGYLKEGLILLGLMVVVAVALPLLAAAVFSTRFLFVGVLAAGAVLLVATPALRRYLSPARAVRRGLAGLGLPEGVALHPKHAWARAGEAGVTVGVDDLLQKVFGPIDEVTLPDVGAAIRAGDPLLTLRRGGRTLAVKAPVDGKVRAVNETLRLDPELLNRSPYTTGWAVELDAPRKAVAGLRTGTDAAGWMRAELDRLVAAVATPAPAPVTLQDGGPIADSFFRELDDASFERLANELF